MINIKILTFNDFQVNTYIIYDETKECVIVDAACYHDYEKNQLADFIKENDLKPVKLINTHSHIDHILGNQFINETYNIPLSAHEGGESFITTSKTSGATFGFNVEKEVFPTEYLNNGDTIKFGNSTLNVLYTPGHAEGSLCFVSEEGTFVITGDVLFSGSIGRTDLPTGNYNFLIESVKEKLFTLPENYIVYPGHGPASSIGREIKTNPFFN